MTDLFKNQLLHELNEAGYHKATMAEDGETFVPIPEYPNLRISSDSVRYGMDADETERDLAHDVMTDIQQRTLDACRAWEHGRDMPGKNAGVEDFRLLSEFNSVVLAARDDGPRGLHLVTWELGHDHSSLNHGHYHTSFTNALEDYATRAGLVPQAQIIDPANAPVLYKALQTMENNYWLTKDHEKQVNALCSQLRQLDREVADKAEAIQFEAADAMEHGEYMEQEM